MFGLLDAELKTLNIDSKSTQALKRCSLRRNGRLFSL